MINSIIPNGQSHVVGYSKNSSLFELNYARLGPFLTSFIRKNVSQTIYPHKESVHRCHTDGFVSSVEIPNIKLSASLGDWKLANSGPCIITNMRKPIWK
jgi:hypothetical protein